MIWITAADIDNWTNKEPRRAQEMLPLLIGKLILASSNDIIDYHFPYGKAVQFSGYDGILETKEKSPHFPDGKSVWEMGTDQNIKDKFNDDYKKRTDEPNGVIQAETTFCFVTSRIWNHRQGIAEITKEKDQQKIWKKVKIIDANNLERWLEDCPSVQMWFSVIIGKPKAGIQDAYSFWKDTIATTDPKLNADYFLYNRESVIKKINNILDSDARQIIIVSSSWLEAILCIVAEIVSSEDKSIKTFGEKCLFVNSYEALKEADLNCKSSIIIPCFHFTDSLPTFSENENFVLIPVNQYDPIDRINKSCNRIEIPARTRHEFCDALEKLGYSSSDAYATGENLRCNFMALYRQICTDTLKKIPVWSKTRDVSILVPALFAGAWEGKKSGDISIISRLSEVSYDEYTTLIHEYTLGENTTLSLIDKTYACISIEEMWDFLWDKITENKFTLFKQCFIEVFNEKDPTYELPEENWYMASVLGKSPSYSKELKEGMILSLIMMVSRKNAQKYRPFTNNIVTECNALVKSVLDNISSLQQWQTICPYLSLLMEAAPEIVLSVLEKEVNLPQSDFWRLFKSSDDFLFGRTFYTHILWALEICIWDKRYATRALNLLIAYAEKGYSYKLSNCPEESLYHIFCLWMPQGVFSLDERKELLISITKNHHSIAPRLFEKLLSSVSQISPGVSKPKWKTIDAPLETVTPPQLLEMREDLLRCYLDSITPCYEDWHFVISELNSFKQITVISEMCKSQKELFSEEDRLKLCKDLSHYISHNRKFNHDTSDRIDIIEQLYNEMLPNSPKCNAHYFSYHFDGLNPVPYDPDNYSYEKERESLYEFQKIKIQEMIDSYGFDSVIEIIPLIEDIPAYANVIAETALKKDVDWDYIFKIKTINVSIASNIIKALYRFPQANVVEKAQAELESDRLGWALSCLTIEDNITKIINESDSEDCKRVYWENVNIFGINTRNESWVKDVINKFLQYKRPYSIIDRFAYGDWNDPNIIIEVLKAALIQQPASEPSGLTLQRVGTYDIEEMFKKLYKKASGLELEIAQLELSYLKVFDLKFEPKCLIDLVLDSPEIYFELLTGAFRSDEGDSKSEDENKKHFAEIAYTALERIRRIPGYSVENKTIDETKFKQWIDATTVLAHSNKYTTAHDVVLGKILSYSPNGTDGNWPAECVRDVFEKPHSDTLESNFIIGKENQRGVYTGTAGKEERKIAVNYKTQADKLQLRYPFTASILLRISDYYYNQAEYERASELRGI